MLLASKERPLYNPTLVARNNLFELWVFQFGILWNEFKIIQDSYSELLSRALLGTCLYSIENTLSCETYKLLLMRPNRLFSVLLVTDACCTYQWKRSNCRIRANLTVLNLQAKVFNSLNCKSTQIAPYWPILSLLGRFAPFS